MTTPGFTATHRAPESGLDAWEQPEASRAPVARLDPRLPVSVVEHQGPWARVVCANGWSAWVIGPQLVEARPGAPTARPSERPRSALAGPAVLAAGVGAAVVVASAFLPWLSLDQSSLNAWDLPLLTVYSEQATTGGLPTASVLVAAAVVTLAAFLIARAGRLLLLLAAGLALNVALAALILARRAQPQLTPGAGVVLALVGGVLVAASLVMTAARTIEAAQ